MTGKEAIVEKILSDARRIANSTLEEANACGKGIISTAENDAAMYREKNMNESYVEREETVRRRITVANLEVKKNVLAKKQELMQKAFDEALKEIKGDGYTDLITAMLDCAEDGDTVEFSESDKKVLDKKFFDGYVKKSGKNIKLGGYGQFSGGIVISGNGNDKNMSLEVEMKSVREEFEPEIAKILFGE